MRIFKIKLSTEQMKKTLLIMSLALLSQIAFAQIPPVTIPGVIKGLTIVLEYSDYKIPETDQEISDLMNKQNYTANGNIGSVRDFFYKQTNGKVTITSTVVRVTLPENYAYYHKPGQQYVESAIDWINEHYPQGFQGLTKDPADGKLLHMNIIERSPSYAGNTNGVDNPKFLKNNTNELIEVFQGNIVSELTGPIPVGTICHEMGHSVMSWPDYAYPFFCNLGYYDIMASARTINGPMPINPALRLQRGWIDNVVDITGDVTQTYTLTANSYSTIHRYKNPNNPKEYLLLHAVKGGDYYQNPFNGKTMPEGLAIWYVREERGLDSPLPADYSPDLIINLLQADNLDEMGDDYSPDVTGDLEDFYGNANKSFPGAHPGRWKDGGEFGINITNISNPGATMSFTVNARPNTIITSTDGFGTLWPRGTLSIANGQNRMFAVTPDLGYEVDAIKENGVKVSSSNLYTVSAFTGTKKLSVSFKRTSPVAPLSAPWQKAAIGSTDTKDFVAQSGNMMYMETYGNKIGGTSDNFTFACQVLNGNGKFIVRIANNNMVAEGKTGLMLRESLNADSEYWSVFRYIQGGAMEQARSTKGAGSVDNPDHVKDLHIYYSYDWLKIERNGDYLTGACSKDGVTWFSLGDTIMPMSTKLYVGVFTKGYDGSYPSQVTFDNISFTTFPSPSVSITSPADNAVMTSRTITINAAAVPASANGSITKVDFYNGTILLGTDNTAPYSFTWTNAPVGLQPINVKATDDNLAVASAKILVDILCNADQKITGGSVIGSPGAFGGSVYNRDKVFNGILTDFFDSPYDTGWVGLSLPSRYKLTAIRFLPRSGFTGRMTGGKFQASNSADFSSGVTDLYTIATEPVANWNCISINNITGFKYVRYVCPNGGFTNVAEIGIYGVSANVAPVVSVVKPANGSVFTAPATVNFEVNATDADGTIARVDFYNGSAYLGYDVTAPFTYTLSDLAAGSYDLIAIAKDNTGAVSAPVVTGINIVISTSDITGPTCGSNNTALTFELSAAKKVNATSYNWWFTGSAQSVTPVQGSPYKLNVATGSNFGAGDICVGVNYSASPYYASYCKTVSKCASRLDESDNVTAMMPQSVIYPNPSADVFNLKLSADAETVSISNNLGETVYLKADLKQGEEILIDEDFIPGVYSLTVKYINGFKETKRMVKLK
jgi:M6 family metalloprotease-like protein